MKAINTICTIILLLLFPLQTMAESPSLQSQIDAAPAYSTIQLKKGVYNEAIVITKPITIDGVLGGKINSCTDSPTVSIQGKDVVLKNITIEKCGDGNSAALYATGNHHTFDSIHVNTEQIGIKLDQASDITILNSNVNGKGKNNGIDLWESPNNTIAGTTLSHVRDGIYLENSNQNVIKQNVIEKSRYGVHLMFSNDVGLYKNTSLHNVTGAMIMEANNTTVAQNNFSYNANNVNAQGLLLYHAKDTNIYQNIISYNRVGMYVEQSERNKLYSNTIQGNFIGIQMKDSQNQTVYGNDFIGNVTEGQAINSTNNQFTTNYWDSSLKLDTTGKGVSSIPYKIDPFFLTLTSDVPEYQVFFQSPGMFLLQKLFKSPDSALLIDWQPAMNSSVGYEKESSSTVSLIIVSALMLAISLSLYIKGRK